MGTLIKNPHEGKTRHFGGVLFVPKDKGKERSADNRLYKNLQEKHLKSYLRGDKMFWYKGKFWPVIEKWY